MIDLGSIIWPWAARSAFSETAGQLLQFCALLGFILLATSYLLIYLREKPPRAIMRPGMFLGSLCFMIALHTRHAGYYPQLLMGSYMLISVIPEKWLRKYDDKNQFQKYL